MTRSQLKDKAKQQLGRNLFGAAWLTAILAIIINSAISSFAAGALIGIGGLIVLGPMSYGLSYVFLKQARDNEKMEIGNIFNGFSNDFGQNLLLGLLSEIFIFLWTLLFIIPGIVKAYSYSMIYYIKVDHPEYDWKKCMDESKRLMKGKKMELFILDLSFIGWVIVGALCLGIGSLWVEPYMMATKAQFYNSLVNYNELV